MRIIQNESNSRRTGGGNLDQSRHRWPPEHAAGGPHPPRDRTCAARSCENGTHHASPTPRYRLEIAPARSVLYSWCGGLALTRANACGTAPRSTLGGFLSTESHALYRVCLRASHGNCAEADDLFGEAALRALQSAGSLEGVHEPFGWWATIVRNLARDWHRRLAVRRAQAEPAADCRHSIDGISHAMARQELLDIRDRAHALSPMQRVALDLRVMGDEYGEIAKTLSTS